MMHINITPFQGMDQGEAIPFGRRISISDKINTHSEAPRNMNVVSKVMVVI